MVECGVETATLRQMCERRKGDLSHPTRLLTEGREGVRGEGVRGEGVRGEGVRGERAREGGRERGKEGESEGRRKRVRQGGIE